MGFLPAAPAARMSHFFWEWLVSVSAPIQETSITMKEGYFEELVLKKEVEPKHFF